MDPEGALRWGYDYTPSPSPTTSHFSFLLVNSIWQISFLPCRTQEGGKNFPKLRFSSSSSCAMYIQLHYRLVLVSI